MGCVGAGGGVTEQVDETVAEIEVFSHHATSSGMMGKKKKYSSEGCREESD